MPRRRSPRPNGRSRRSRSGSIRTKRHARRLSADRERAARGPQQRAADQEDARTPSASSASPWNRPPARTTRTAIAIAQAGPVIAPTRAALERRGLGRARRGEPAVERAEHDQAHQQHDRRDRARRTGLSRRRRRSASRRRRSGPRRRPRPGTAARARQSASAVKRAPAAERGQLDAVLGRERRLLDQRGGRRAPGAHPPAFRPTCTSQPEQADRRADDEHPRERSQRGQRGAASAAAAGGRSRGLQSGSAVAAPITPPSAPQSTPSANAAAGEVRDPRRLALPADQREQQHQQPERHRDQRRPAEPRTASVAPSVRWICQRVVRISAPSGTADSRSGWMRRVPDDQQAGLLHHRGQQRADGLPEALGDDPRVDPDQPDDRVRRRDHRQQQPGRQHDHGQHRGGDGRRDDPGNASRSRTPGELRCLRAARPSRPRGGGAAVRRRRGRGRRGRPRRRADRVVGRRGRGRGRFARRRGPSSARGGSASPGGGRPRPSRPSAGAGRDAEPSSRAPQAEQNRARALIRSPQLGQKMVSATRSPIASVAPYGYHLGPMEAACGS